MYCGAGQDGQTECLRELRATELLNDPPSPSTIPSSIMAEVEADTTCENCNLLGALLECGGSDNFSAGATNATNDLQ